MLASQYSTDSSGRKMRIADIRAGDRHRKDLGDITGLAKSIDNVGLLHPPVVTPEGMLIAGERRLAALRMLGWDETPVTVVDLQDIVRGEHDENICRKDFTPSEAVAIAKALEPMEREAAKKRQGTRTDILPENFTGGNAIDKVASAVGMSRPTFTKAKELVEAAEREPDEFAPLVERMDRTGNVHGAFKELKKRQQERAAQQVDQAAGQALKREVKTGQFWRLGPHTLYCGDTSAAKFRDAAPACALAFADPPYGAEVAAWDSAFYWEHDWLINVADVVAVTPGIISIFEFARKTQMPYRWSAACWIDNGMTRGAMGFGNWIYVALFSQSSIYRNAQDFCKTSISVSETDQTKHKGRKPAGLLLWLLQTFTETGNTVIDPFLGSGTTLLAAQASGRVCYGGEKEPLHCDEIISRWESQTGEVAHLIA